MRLPAKLSLALICIITIMGGAVYVVDRVTMRTYYDELSQQLNAPIAMYVTDQRQLIADGVADLDSLRELAGHAMVINPTAEIYLLDARGNILGHSLADDAVSMGRVDLEPIRTLIGGAAAAPVYGQDPRSPGNEKVFSAHPVTSEAGLEGYLYVILGGQRYEALASNIGDSYFARISAAAMIAIVVLAAAIGSLAFALLTRRLRRLDDDMQRVTAARFEVAPALARRDAHGDEIDALTNAFVDMSSQIRRQIDQLRENDRLRRELVANISHDLRTPLSAMQGYLETLLIKGETMTPDDRQRFLGIARKHTVRLGTLIEDLFELAKLDSASVVPQVEQFSLAELIQDTVQEFQIEAERKDIVLSIDIERGPLATRGDIGLIQRVLENLVRNAVKFTPTGGHVTIAIDERPEAIAVAVSDDGPGIAARDLPRIFDRFYRVRDGEEARSDSSGIGLAIVKRILDLHDSRITVESEAGSGTRFEFELPLVREAA